ncbi:MAG: hypothetical protein NZ517_00090 [Candidatus Nitrosocaldus sp.]|nr:hypothetical protein [Candidatus Nitrosocaldus sp.]
MPEIWLRYGTSEVVLDIKAENMLRHARLAEEPMSDDVLSARYEAICSSVDGPVDMVILDGSRVAAGVASRLVSYLEGRGRSIGGIYSTARVTGIDARPFRGIASGRRTVLISRAALDPVFTYSCTATALMRLDTRLMHNAYNAFIHGEHSRIREMVDGYLQGINSNSTSLEIIQGERGIVDLLVCDTPSSYHLVSSRLDGLAYHAEVCRSIIASPGHTYRLTDALTALWNCSRVLKGDDGIIIMLAECVDGLGAEALQMLVEGRIQYTAAVDSHGYVDGLEYVHMIKAMREKGHDLGLVTMLPERYVRALGFRAFRRIRDALAYILGRMGQRHKVMVVSDAYTMPLVRV